MPKTSAPGRRKNAPKSRAAGAKGAARRTPVRGAASRRAGGRSTGRATRSSASRVSRTSRPKWVGVLGDLYADHQKVRKLLAELEAADSGPERQRLFQECDRELVVHSRLEEEIFYPAFHDATGFDQEDRKVYFESLEEHNAVDRLLDEMRGADYSTDRFAAQCKVLKDFVEHHAGEEETEMFPEAAKVMGSETLAELGERCRLRREELVASFSGTASRVLAGRALEQWTRA